MKIVDDIFYEELIRKEAEIRQLSHELKLLPRGTLFFRRTGNSIYVYRKWKEKGKVLSTYIGKVGTNIVDIEIERSNEYKFKKEKYKNAVKEYKELQKAYNLLNKKRNK